MGYGFKVEIWGDYACFSRPELKVERVSYDVMTPSAARGILEAVFWKPAIKYVIDEIAVCAPIKFENIRRNEVNSKAPQDGKAVRSRALRGELYIAASDERAQRASMVLRDVRYVVSAHFEPTSRLGDGDKLPDGSFNHGKFADEIRRRLEKGQNFHTPDLGTREFPANIRLVAAGDAPPAIDESRELGLMLYDLEFVWDGDTVKDWRPMYFRAAMKHGVIAIPKPDSGEVLR
jgi:CRISPR-associated protein Cas5d